MSLILNIDTASDTAYISIAKDALVLAEISNSDAKGHAAFLQTAIESISKKIGMSLHDLDAVAVAGGPGSYTGLRVGMASAKGLCYALKKPMITVSNLEILACGAIKEFESIPDNTPSLFCPMIDARRMEVFTAIYDEKLISVLPPATMILNEKSFATWLLKNQIFFIGTGAEKWGKICPHEHARFNVTVNNSNNMNILSYKKWMNQVLADVAYAVPDYLKEFQSNSNL